jgi:hypothetical protein
MVKTTAVGLAFLIAAGVFAADKPDADLAANAALKYWCAFSTMPKLDEKTAPVDVAAMPLDDKAKALVASADYALEQMHYGAALPRCVWAPSMEEDGVRTRLPYLQAVRNLSALAVLRMRLRFEAGQKAEAVDDAIDALTLGRHASTDGTLISVLVGIAVDHSVTDVLAEHLPDLDKESLKKLAARLEMLPPAGTAALAMLSAEEHGGLDWFIRQVKQAKDKDQLLELLGEVSDGPSADAKREAGKALLEACGGTAEGILKFAQQARPLYEIVAKKMDLPPEQFDKEVGALVKGEAKDNPIFKLLFPAVSRVRAQEARLQTRQALRKAALAILIDGADAAKAQRDPFGDGPFEYQPFDGGFELRSKFQYVDKQVSLTVGRRKEKEK